MSIFDKFPIFRKLKRSMNLGLECWWSTGRCLKVDMVAAWAALDSQLKILEIDDRERAEDVGDTEDGDKVDNKE